MGKHGEVLNYKVDANNIETVFALIESGEKEKMIAALDAIKDNPEATGQVEKRYLNIVRARLKDREAGLERLPEGMLNSTEIKMLFDERHVTQKIISFSYCDDHYSRLIIDTIGAVVANYFDINTYMKEVEAIEKEKMIKDFPSDRFRNIRYKLSDEIRVNPEGWYARLCEHLYWLCVDKLLFNKTEFEVANRSLVFNEFMFFIITSGVCEIDIHQSETPHFGKIFWMSWHVPNTIWSDVEPAIPESTLKFVRKAKFRTSDSGKWKVIVRPDMPK
ncbi:MAG: hypothetical protein K0S33_2966 [Bacteroidetes bacterium]|jgi:hypothetical protein|nr:hypothetical protein [Bacteroidota bacterium]